MHLARNALLATLLSSFTVALAEPPAREPLTLPEPSWKAGKRQGGPDFQEALARLQAMAANFPEGQPLGISSPQPCVLRVARGHDATAYRDASRMFVLQVTWVDLTRASRIQAQSFGTMQPTGNAMAASCAWFTGEKEFALASEVVALAGRVAPNRRVDHAPEEQPRLCLGGEVEAKQLEAVLAALLEVCRVR